MVTAIVLASGLSRRMGRDKLRLDYKDKPMAAYVIEAVALSRVDARVIVTNAPWLAELAPGFLATENPCAEEGLSSSVRTGVMASAADSDYMFFAADQPLISAAVIDGMLAFAKKNPGRIITPADGRGSPALFPNGYRKRLLSLSGDSGGRSIISAEPDAVAVYSISEEILFDVDDARDYLSLLRGVTKKTNVHTIYVGGAKDDDTE